MKVSVIVPIYNVEKYLPKCLDSLVSQTLKEIEIILVDDGSPDNSKKIAEKYMKKHKNIMYFRKENGGQGSARNYGLTKATGEYIAYVDSDDYVDTDMFEKMYNKAIETSSDIVICGHKLVLEDGTLKDTYLPCAYSDSMKNILLGDMAVWNKIYKRELIDISFREKVWYEDIDFSIKLLFSTDKISFVNEGLYNYLLRQGSTMNNKNATRNLELLDAFNDMIKYLKSKKTYKKHYSKLEFLAIYHIYIMGITRILRMDIDKKVKKDIISKYLDYINKNFKTYRKNEYIKYIDINKKIIYRLISMRLYFMVRLIFKLRG